MDLMLMDTIAEVSTTSVMTEMDSTSEDMTAMVTA